MEQVNVMDTAFWMACCRASDEKLSRDLLAKHWVTDDTRKVHESYLKEVAPSENLLMCLRNRFFLEAMETFFAEHPNGQLVNIGAGVTSYPYLLKSEQHCLEVDCKAVIDVKKKKMHELARAGQVSARPVDFLECDLNSIDDMQKLESYLEGWVTGPTFFLIEGVLYYLNRESVDRLIALCAEIQDTWDVLGLVTWKPDFMSGEFYKKFSAFLTQRLGQPEGKYTCVDNEYFAEMDDYTVLSHMDNPKLLQKYVPGTSLSTVGTYADEQLFILERK